MSLPTIVSPDEWRAARVALLEDEKAMTRARDALNVRRRQLPMVRVDQDYRFEGPEGPPQRLGVSGRVGPGAGGGDTGPRARQPGRGHGSRR